MILNVITLCLVTIYGLFIVACIFFWNKMKDTTGDEIKMHEIPVDIIIPMRNESDNLKTLIESLKKQNYSTENFRLIFVDDHSTDHSPDKARQFCKELHVTNAIFLSSPKESKKEAIRFGLENSTAELIVTTDADTVRGEMWLPAIVNHYAATGAAMICGPVRLAGAENFTERIQEIEFCGLTAMSAAAIDARLPMFCNGANLAFSRTVFFALNGFEGSKSHSGDDTQLMLKIHSSGIGKIEFIKDERAIVTTRVAKQSDLIRQRRRWASKIPATLSLFTIFIAFLSWAVHGLLFVQMIFSIINLDFRLFFILLLLKVVPEIAFLNSAGDFYRLKFPMWMILAVQPLYWFYIFYVGLVSPFKSYHWKGRIIRGNNYVENS